MAMLKGSGRSHDWFRWWVSLCLLVLAGLSTYNTLELRKLRQELKLLQTPRTLPLAEAGQR